MQSIPFIASPNCWQGRFGHKPTHIIVHGTAGGSSAANIAHWFANPAAQAAAHYIDDLDGSIIQCVKETDAAWANGEISGPAGISGDRIHHDTWWDASPIMGNDPNPNIVTISIEHVKPHDDNSDILTAAQQASSFALIADICKRWNIPMRQADALGGITGHFSIDPENRSDCPGPYPWSALWDYLKQQGASMIPDGWHDDGTTLTAPSGHKVVRGFRAFVLDPKNQWSKDNYPIEEEHGQAPLELSNLALGSGTQQLFRWTALGWTPTQGVFLEWIGEEVEALRAKVAELSAEITKLKTPQATK